MDEQSRQSRKMPLRVGIKILVQKRKDIEWELVHIKTFLFNRRN